LKTAHSVYQSSVLETPFKMDFGSAFAFPFLDHCGNGAGYVGGIAALQADMNGWLKLASLQGAPNVAL